MQLFSIGLWKLNPDGTQMLDSSGQPIPTYDNEAIMDFARVFTGFNDQPNRGNYEHLDGRNWIDPMRMTARHHDMYPKPDLDGNYIGDGYPLCSDAADQAFLAKGAKFSFVGASKHLDPDHKEGALVLDSSSGLYQALCFESGGKCNLQPHCRTRPDHSLHRQRVHHRHSPAAQRLGRALRILAAHVCQHVLLQWEDHPGLWAKVGLVSKSVGIPSRCLRASPAAMAARTARTTG